ncbi:MAG: hypothetical protein R2856_05305 [Caldilineaceae bacterium]
MGNANAWLWRVPPCALAPIVILDEPTTGLDQESAQTVHAALDRLTEGRTSLIITHDLRAAESADRIYFVEAGEIRESGTHHQLLAQNGRYAALYAIQSAATGEEEPVYVDA